MDGFVARSRSALRLCQIPLNPHAPPTPPPGAVLTGTGENSRNHPKRQAQTFQQARYRPQHPNPVLPLPCIPHSFSCLGAAGETVPHHISIPLPILKLLKTASDTVHDSVFKGYPIWFYLQLRYFPVLCSLQTSLGAAAPEELLA